MTLVCNEEIVKKGLVTLGYFTGESARRVLNDLRRDSTPATAMAYLTNKVSQLNEAGSLWLRQIF